MRTQGTTWAIGDSLGVTMAGMRPTRNLADITSKTSHIDVTVEQVQAVVDRVARDQHKGAGVTAKDVFAISGRIADDLRIEVIDVQHSITTER